MLSPIVENEEVHRWAFMPATQTCRFLWHQCLFQTLLQIINTGNLRKSIGQNAGRIKEKPAGTYLFAYPGKSYGISSLFSRDIAHSLEDEKTGLVKYYKLNLDSRFIEIKTTSPLPELRIDEFHYGTYDHKWSQRAFGTKITASRYAWIEGFGILEISGRNIRVFD